MDAEFQVTTGSWFVGRGLLTEAEGDQPGCLAALRENVLEMGFRPLAYGNIKGFLNHTPGPQEMEYWSARNGIRVRQVVSFTDGTKLQIEQALVANGLHAAIVRPGMLGIQTDDLNHAASVFSSHAAGCGEAISDYVLSAKLPPGVFIVAEHDPRHREGLRYLKMGDGPCYVLLRNYHLCHLEVSKTIHRVCHGGGVLLDNSARPRFGVFARSKRILQPGERIAHGIGSYDVRGVGMSLREADGMIPIGLIQDAVVARRVAADEFVGMDDVEIPESLALRAWLAIRVGVAQGREAAVSACPA